MVPILCDTGVQPDGIEPNITQLGAIRAATGDPADIPVPTIPVPDGIVPSSGDLFAVRVTAPGAERLFAQGSLLVCQRLIDGVEDLPDGTLVVLRAGGKTHTRVDIHEAEHFDGYLWLWLRSPHPDWQQPLSAPVPLIEPTRVTGGETVTSLGIVVASWQPQAPMTPI